MIGYIYITTNLINGKKYIGKHKAKKYDRHYLGSGSILRQAILKYGYINFDNKILEECESLDELNEREKYWISYYNAVKSNDFYNIMPSGELGFEYINSNRDKISINYKRTPEQCKHISEGRISSGCCKGDKNPMYGKRGESSPHYGKIAITNGEITKYVYPEELENYEGYHIGKDEEYKKRLKNSTSDKYYYNNIEFIGSYDLRAYLRENGYPKISQTAIYKLSKGLSVRGYEELFNKITVTKVFPKKHKEDKEIR